MTTSAAVIHERRADIDSLRVFALALLIVYHVLLAYSGTDFWRVRSVHGGYWADYVIALVRPWRLPLVFLVGGVAARFMIERSALGAFAWERASKLLVAFVFAVLVLVPPQRFVLLDNEGLAHGMSYWDYLTGDAMRVQSAWGVPLPDFAHAWFLPYLFLYSVLAAFVWRFAPGAMRFLQRRLEAAPVLLIVAGAMAWLAFVLSVILPIEQPTNILLTERSGHLLFAPAFLIGFLLGKSAGFRTKLDTAKLPLFGVVLVLALCNVGAAWLHLNAYHADPALWTAVRGCFGAAALFGVLAFGAWAWSRPSPALTYASDAILPVYLMHQTVLVMVGDTVVPQHWPLPMEMTTLLASTLAAPLVIYHLLVRGNPPLRRLFGLRPLRRSESG